MNHQDIVEWKKLKCKLLNERRHMKRLHTVLFLLHDILRKQNSEHRKKISGC